MEFRFFGSLLLLVIASILLYIPNGINVIQMPLYLNLQKIKFYKKYQKGGKACPPPKYEWYILIQVSGFLSPKNTLKCKTPPIVFKVILFFYTIASIGQEFLKKTTLKLPDSSLIK